VRASDRTTVAGAAEVRGVTLFTGVSSRVTIRPGAPGTGIVFVRVDLPVHEPIPARAEFVVPESRRTVLALPDRTSAGPIVLVQTVEHVLSAIAGLGVHDAIIEVDGPEVPIGDGSALPFVEAILAAGPVSVPCDSLSHLRQPIVVRERIEITDPRGPQFGTIVAEPRGGGGAEEGLELTYHLDYGPNAPIAPQTVTFVSIPGDGRYQGEIAPARTFSTLDEAKAMRAMGLFTHLTAAQMLVIGPDGPVENQYRFPDEPARHKVLDMLGDLSLGGAGRPIQARITAWRSGHALNHAMALRLAGM